MDGKSLQELIQATRKYTQEDLAHSIFLFWTTVLVWLAALGLTMAPLHWALRSLGSLVAGLTMVRLFIFYHDYQHEAIFRNSPFMKWVMQAYGILILNPPSIWKRSHNYHHQNNAQMVTASIGSFPVLTIAQYETATWYQKAAYRFVRSPLNMVLGYITIFILGMCLRSFVKDPRRHLDSLVALVVHALLIAGVWHWAGLTTLFFGLLFPFFIAHALGAYLFYIQHNFPNMQLRPRTEWSYLFAAFRSSSYMEGGKLTEWFTGNIGYHHIHHLNSRIPFYRLPEAMAEVPELQDPIRTSLRPTDIYQCLRLKLWDPETGQMVGFPRAKFTSSFFTVKDA